MKRALCIGLGVMLMSAGAWAQTARPRTPPPGHQPPATRPQPPQTPSGGMRRPGHKPPEGQRPAPPGSRTGQKARPRGGRG